MKRNGRVLDRRERLLMSNSSSTIPMPQEFKMGPGKVVRYRRADAIPQYITDSPTASKFVATLKGVDAGEVGDIFRLSEEMQSKDAHMQGVVNTRTNAVTALEWETIPAVTDPKRQRMADEAAKFVEEELLNLRTFPDTLVHLTQAIDCGVSVTELIWKDFRLVETNDVPGFKLKHDLDSGRLLVETPKRPLGAQMPPGKFLVYIPKPRAGFPFRVTLTRAAAWLYLIKHFVFADWAGFSERFGMPIPVGTCGDEATPADVANLETALDNLMSEGYAVLPEGCGIELKEAARNTQPYGDLMTLVDNKLSILYLGQTLTTEMQSVGSFAAAKVHDNVRSDILLSDIRQEATAIKYGIIAPMVQLRFPNKDVPLPVFKRVLHETRYVEGERLTMDQITLAKELGMPLDQDWLYEALSIPKPVEEVPSTQDQRLFSPSESDEVDEGEMNVGTDVAKRVGDAFAPVA